jgi:phage FluMu protein Com
MAVVSVGKREPVTPVMSIECRCFKCGRRLFDGTGETEIICPSCRTRNYFSNTGQKADFKVDTLVFNRKG